MRNRVWGNGRGGVGGGLHPHVPGGRQDVSVLGFKDLLLEEVLLV